MQDEVSKAERCEIERHRGKLSEQRGCNVSFEEASADWETHCAQRWREQCQADMLAKQREEILRHKWIESEKAQRDLGGEAAFDWILRYAAEWRKWYEEQHSTTEIHGRA